MTCPRVPQTLLMLLPTLALAGCVVEEHCFSDNECAGVAVCVRGTCQTPADAGPLPDGLFPDGLTPVRCTSGDMVLAQRGVLRFCVDRYEASRPDATATDPGTKKGQAMSRKGVLPWQVINNAEATAACAAAGKRLCSAAEWGVACMGPKWKVYAYGDTYNKTICNGIDTYPNWGFHLMPTGSFPNCVNAFGVYDMNGNVWEHVKDGSGQLVRGGAFNCSDSKTFQRCDYIPGNWTPSALGFRCCADPVPGANKEAGAKKDGGANG